MLWRAIDAVTGVRAGICVTVERLPGKAFAADRGLFGSQTLAVADGILGADVGVWAQGCEGLCRIRGVDVRIVVAGDPGLRIERQPIADR